MERVPESTQSWFKILKRMADFTVMRDTACVLVAEDSSTEREVLLDVLRDAGFEAHYAPDGRYALDLCRIIHPDLLILDLGLPRVNGFDVLRRLRDDRRVGGTPVIVLTADARRETADRVLYEGASDFIAKPFDDAELVERVHETLRSVSGVASD